MIRENKVMLANFINKGEFDLSAYLLYLCHDKNLKAVKDK